MFRKKLKLFFIFAGCLLFRLIPLRAPNVEPIMASIMPISKKYGAFFAFAFGFLSIFLFDLLTFFGSWTWITAITYGLIGLFSYLYFSKYKDSVRNFVFFAILATLFYDLITGVLFAPLFNQTMLNALMMQIPFTLLHLAGSVGFSLTLTPVLNRWLKRETSLNLSNSLISLKKI